MALETSNRIKLTEDDISFDYDDGNGLCIYLEDYKDFEQLKQQILNNQKIVDKLVNFCDLVNIAEENSGTDNFINNIEHMQVSSLTIQDLIKEVTGKDIKDL